MEEQMSRLTHDLMAEILSRVPYKSLCICKCVCPAWRDLIADPESRKKIVQSLAGFFYHIPADSAEPRGLAVNYADLSAFPWSSVPRTYPRLPLPPDSADCSFTLKDSCDGLFLTRIGTGTPELQFRYMVSNPATDEHWVPPVVTGVNIYSSETGAWVAMEPKWDIQVSLCGGPPGVFHKGCLHLLIHLDGLAILDAQGLNWRTIPVPNFIDPSFSGFIGKSAGQLFYINSDDSEEGYGSTSFSTISVYVLSSGIYNWDASYLDDGCAHWILLHKLSDVIPKENFCLGWDLKVIGVHPHANIIFMADFNNNELLAYDLDHRESTAVHHIERTYLAHEQYFPYVPLLSSLRLPTPS
ncbi:hypothetical protein CFC21_100029 [Triticum aestivum]|uniref:F-box domain-containing protein n=3 Tax=Triticum TaxID=4564 RepID=A0A9R0ZMB4_TRITD|nr:uncharacterized protein LOC123149281 [Triticum aestivum]KAF7098276.1 hypothetical protein CFC21_100029 [Triticum aestivum]VAI80416.1 unnamed protein product [Triticum turgidum subsp. durum]